MHSRERQETSRPLVQFFVHFFVIALLAGNGVPDVNESHYIPKAKHAWDPTFAPGDLFYESSDTHMLATALAGSLSTVLPLTAVAWIGRLISWLLFSWAWTRFARALQISSAHSALALASWILAIAYGHWAGEWAIGGFEAKSIAYPLGIVGVACACEGRWKFAWLWIGGAMAWHPVVGGWIGLSCGLLWLWESKLRSSVVLPQIPWIAGGLAIGALGALPALGGIGGSGREGPIVATQVQVFFRIAHHMCPRTFAVERHYAVVFTMLAFIFATLFWRSRTRSPETEKRDKSVSRLLRIACIAIVFALFGLAIDLTLSISQPELASKLLRFYWFRWFDVVVPLAWTTVLWAWISRAGCATEIQSNSSLGPQLLSSCAAIACIGLAALIVVPRLTSDVVPRADNLVVQPVGKYQPDTDRHRDWLAVCAWIESNTPQDSLWMTPKHQQTFKWYAGRAEVVCWKDVPQDNASIIEWYRRVERMQPPRDRIGDVRGWTTEELKQLAAEYGFEWILVDRSIQTTIPLLELAYPIDIENKSFAVFRIRK